MTGTPKKLDDDSRLAPQEPQPLNSSSSRIAELFEDPDFRLEWDNDCGYHIARNVQELRKYRGITQAELAARAKTSQPQVARVESGDANLTIRTLCKLIEGLEGRLYLAIEPAECSSPRLPVWWEWLPALPCGPQVEWSHAHAHLTIRPNATAQFFVGWGGNLQGGQAAEQKTFKISAAPVSNMEYRPTTKAALGFLDDPA